MSANPESMFMSLVDAGCGFVGFEVVVLDVSNLCNLQYYQLCYALASPDVLQ